MVLPSIGVSMGSRHRWTVAETVIMNSIKKLKIWLLDCFHQTEKNHDACEEEEENLTLILHQRESWMKGRSNIFHFKHYAPSEASDGPLGTRIICRVCFACFLFGGNLMSERRKSHRITWVWQSWTKSKRKLFLWQLVREKVSLIEKICLI